MTTAQKNAKAKFKQAIAYRQKTGVSLKEAFAHIYGKKKVGSVAKKSDHTAYDVLKYKGDIGIKKFKSLTPAQRVKGAKKAKKTKKVNGIGNTYIFKVYDRDDFGDPINNSFKKVTISASNQNDAKNKVYKKFPSSKYFCELQESYSNKVGALKLKPNEMRLGLLSNKVGATVKKKKAKKPSEQSILNKIHIVKKGVDKLDEAQHKHMMGKLGKVHNYNLIALKGALSQLKDLETHLAILKNVKPKIVKTQLPVIRREIKNTVNSIKEIKIHITQLKKYI